MLHVCIFQQMMVRGSETFLRWRYINPFFFMELMLYVLIWYRKYPFCMKKMRDLGFEIHLVRKLGVGMLHVHNETLSISLSQFHICDLFVRLITDLTQKRTVFESNSQLRHQELQCSWFMMCPSLEWYMLILFVHYLHPQSTQWNAQR